MLHCHNCGCEILRRTVVARLGEIDGWSCVPCKTFYKTKDQKKTVLTV